MLFPELIRQQLEDKKDNFRAFDCDWQRDVGVYARHLRSLDHERLQTIIAAPGVPEPRAWRALPALKETARHDGLQVKFAAGGWRTHEEARRWALETLLDRTTFAADGSQLLLERETSLPIAAVQAAWFENAHTREGNYSKQAILEVITPDEILAAREQEKVLSEAVISVRRTKLELKVIGDFMHRKAGWRERGERMPLAMFDGAFSFLLSFRLGQKTADAESPYAGEIDDLLKLSQETQVPVVAFTDQTFAKDLVRLIDLIEHGTPNQSRYPMDAQILCAATKASNETESSCAFLARWGERTTFCYYLPRGIKTTEDSGESALSLLRGAALNAALGFVYLQTTGDGAPARVEMPAWIFGAGLLDETLDALRAECVCGLGYPYALETADAAAVLTTRDREQFLRVVQNFAAGEEIAFRVSRKAASKARRR